MEDNQRNMQDAIYKNLQENKNYAYEIKVEDNAGQILIVPRTGNIEAFYKNMESAINIAKHEGKNIKVSIYRGISPKAGIIEEYPISIKNSKQNNTTAQHQIESAVESVMKKYNVGNNSGVLGGLDNVNQLLGVITGNVNNDGSNNQLSGLVGLLGAVNNSRYENTLMQFEKKLNDYKQETEIDSLKKQLNVIIAERDTLRKQNLELESSNNSFKTEVNDLENRLAGYSNTEILKRVATGVLSGIGSKLLAGSPKAAELMGLTKEEFQAALGFAEEDGEDLAGDNDIPQTDIEIEEVSTSITKQEEQIFQAIDNTANALKQGDKKFAYYMISIVGNCLDSAELTESIIQHLNQEINRLGLNVDEANSQEHAND